MRTKKEFYEEKYLNLLNQSKEDLAFMVKDFVLLSESAPVILFHDLGISKPIYIEDTYNAEMSETIYSAFIDYKGKVGFSVDNAVVGEYDITMEDLDMDMTLYLLGEFEGLN